MTILLPLGLLGLLSLIAWFIIYIIKPNYQQKVISSTYIWRLSMKLKKRRLPVSKLRNILLIICQILILVICAFLLAQPAQVLRTQITQKEVIAIIDSSASMLTETDGESRFNRAVSQAMELTDEVFNEEGIVSVIIAEDSSSFLAERVTSSSQISLNKSMNDLIKNEESCSYGVANIDSSMELCEQVLEENPNAEIYLYTDTTYSYVPDNIHVVNVAETGEWNAAILNAYTVSEDNYYTVYVEVACYGRDQEIPVAIEVYNANASDSNDNGSTVLLNATVYCNSESTQTVIFRNASYGSTSYEQNAENITIVPISSDNQFYSYQDIHISIEVSDNFSEDDNFDIYNGLKHVIKVQYASSDPCDFFVGALETIKRYYKEVKDVWDVQLTEVTSDKAQTSGYDFYIFEGVMPEKMPTDGVVFLCDLDAAPKGSGLILGNIRLLNEQLALTKDSDHELLNYLSPGNVIITKYTNIVSYDPAYEVLLSCNTSPVLLVKNESDSKVVVMPFSLHYSTFSARRDFSTLMLNMVKYFFPITVENNSYEVYQSVSIQARGQEVEVYSSYSDETLTMFPATIYLNMPGTYTLKQITDFGVVVEDKIYVKIPASESNIWKTEDSFKNPYLVQIEIDYYEKLTTYVAAALLLFVFIEWLLQAHDNM